MNKASTNVRLGIDGDEDVKRRMRETGEVGDRALKQIADASRPASGGLKAVNAASQEGRAALSAYAAQAGPLGGILTSIGPAGFAAAAGIGALVAGMRGASAAAQEFAGIKRSADELGVSLQTLQEVRGLALLGSGGDSDKADEGLATFLERISEAKQGSGDAAETFARLGVAVTDTNGRLRDGQAVMLDVSDALSRLDSGAERLELRRVLFGDEDGKAFIALDRGREVVEGLIAEARTLGLVLDESVIAKGAEVQRQMTITSRVIDLNLKQAFIELAPIMVTGAEFALNVARGISRIRDEIVALESMSLDGLRRDVAGLNDEIAKGEERLATGTRNSLRDGVPVDMTAGDRAREQVAIDALKAERATIEAEIDARATAASTKIAPTEILGLPPVEVGATDTLAKARDTIAELVEARRRQADVEADIAAQARTIALIRNGEVETAEAALRLATELATIERAERDARREGEAAGLKGDDLQNVISAARARADADIAAANSQRALSEARAAASKSAAEDQARATRDAAEQARVDAGRLAAAARLTDQATTLVRAREEGGLVARAVADAALATDREALDLADRTLRREQDAARVRAAGAAAARGADKEFDNASALRAKAEAIEREAIATRDLTEAYAENRRIVEGRADAVRVLSEAQATLDEARRSNAPVFAALDEIAAARSLEDLDVLRERIEGERDLLRIREAGNAAVENAGEFGDPEALRKVAEDRVKETIALREGNEELAERTRQIKGEQEAYKTLADAQAALERARAAAEPVAEAALKIPDISNVVDFEKVRAERKRQEDALAVTVAGDAAARGAGDFGDPVALRAVAEEMAQINQARRDNNDLITKGGEALKEQAAAQDRANKAAQQTLDASLKANRAMLDGFANAIREGRDLEDVLKRVAIQLAEVAVKGLLDGATGNVSGGKGFVGDLFTGLGGSLLGAINPFGVETYEGGGHTRSGPRVGGLDGKGGYMAMIHPNERIDDLTRPGGGQQGGMGDINYSPTYHFTGGGMSRRDADRLMREADDRALNTLQDARMRGTVGV